MSTHRFHTHPTELTMFACWLDLFARACAQDQPATRQRAERATQRLVELLLDGGLPRAAALTAPDGPSADLPSELEEWVAEVEQASNHPEGPTGLNPDRAGRYWSALMDPEKQRDHALEQFRTALRDVDPTTRSRAWLYLQEALSVPGPAYRSALRAVHQFLSGPSQTRVLVAETLRQLLTHGGEPGLHTVTVILCSALDGSADVDIRGSVRAAAGELIERALLCDDLFSQQGALRVVLRVLSGPPASTPRVQTELLTILLEQFSAQSEDKTIRAVYAHLLETCIITAGDLLAGHVRGLDEPVLDWARTDEIITHKASEEASLLLTQALHADVLDRRRRAALSLSAMLRSESKDRRDAALMALAASNFVRRLPPCPAWTADTPLLRAFQSAESATALQRNMQCTPPELILDELERLLDTGRHWGAAYVAATLTGGGPIGALETAMLGRPSPRSLLNFGVGTGDDRHAWQ